ncbi:uncharacterized protein [Physcomitrium patens]|uniref:Uncharacterized protein n=2 Tax=Physcomitrium patens TaxID=3218 RepID=A9SJ61_PHYPA|nr:ribonuclease H2 subunit C-like isoform X1 [Physcomitrium patens]PNR59643.1 hypothetical protein PHYPA_002435 [Physcomitrium patens]|eukprot:XP_024359456.1 ribonuclease H2 subunit C-like isoform X1 [Physcomitrella patens]
MGSLKNENDQREREGCFGVMSVESGLEGKRIHLLPCGTNYTGPAPVEDYFKIKAAGSNEDGIVMEEAAFRGRKLMGSRLPLPEGFCGFVLKKVIGSNNENGKIKVKSLEKDGFDVWKADAMFGEFSYWNHDTLPTKDDSIRSVMEWLPVSAALHEEVTADGAAVIAEKMKLQSESLAGSKRKL